MRIPFEVSEDRSKGCSLFKLYFDLVCIKINNFIYIINQIIESDRCALKLTTIFFNNINKIIVFVFSF